MTVVHYTAEVRPGLLLALPEEARHLPLHPGDKIEVQFEMPLPQAPEIEESKLVDPKAAASIALLKSWLEEDATDDPDELRQAQEELDEFKRNMNAPRKEAGARLLYPEAE